MPKDYGSWSLVHLKDELRKRNAKTTGRKAALVQRLLEYDIMFGPLVNNPDESYTIKVPAPEHFLDINSSSTLPKITEEDIEQYCMLRERENLTTSKNMYEENYLIAGRVFYWQNEFYIKSVCAAEMRKSVLYNITLKVVDNTIIEAQCECAAGMGPYAQCKHVLVLMYGLADFAENKILKTRSSPTSLLQTFHQPAQVYAGEPVTADKFVLKLQDSNLKRITSYDPRPQVTSTEKYNENFMNLTMNFAASQLTNMPIQQLRKPANKMALFRDHDYLEKTAEEMFLDSLILTNEKRHEINTRKNKKIWKELRKLRLQSSNFGKICKSNTINKNKLAKELLKSTDFLTVATKHGMKYEKSALKKLSDVIREPVINCGMFINKEYQFLASTPDGLVGDNAVVEVKCPYSAKDKVISAETVPYLYLCDESGEWKLCEKYDYYYQVQGQMLCTGRSICYFGVYTLTDFIVIKIERNENFIQKMLQNLKKFYCENYKYLFLCKHFYNIKFN